MLYNAGKHNGTEIKAGDVVRVAGGYAKNNNGLFFVTTADGAGLWLKKLNKSGTISEADYATQQFPPRCYASDPAKRAAARVQNEKATIEKAEGINTFYVAEYFRKRAEEQAAAARRYSDNGWEKERQEAEQRAAEYTEIAERAEQTAEKPAEKAPEKGLKIYWNGMKIDGGKLVKCWYSAEEKSVTIYADGYGAELPRQFFAVKNDTDIMTDYFDKDSAVVSEDHPLYKYVRYAALKTIFSGHSYRQPTEAQRAEWAAMKDPGQPTEKDLAEIDERRTAAENARKAREQAEAAERREKMLRKRAEDRRFIQKTIEQFPVVAGEPVVVIDWSEHPALGDPSWLTPARKWEKDAKETRYEFSIAAAEKILGQFDAQEKEKEGYFKTHFTIHYTDEQTGEASTYEGRYDLGDGDGGLVQHIRDIGKWERTHDSRTGAEIKDAPAEQSARENFADWLEKYTDGGRIEKITVAPWIGDYLKAKAEAEQEAKEQRKREVDEIMETVRLLTNEQLVAAVFAVDPKDKEQIDVARFFAQELARRDPKLAIETFKKWSEGAGR